MVSMMIINAYAQLQTDIKEAVFLGDNDELVAAGSDIGHVFIYNAGTGEVSLMSGSAGPW